MQECAIAMSTLLGCWLGTFDTYSTGARTLIVLGIFLAGYLEATVFKLRRSALITWFWGLIILVACIGFPWTTASIAAGVVVFILGLILLVAYYRSWKANAGKPTG